MKKFIFALLIFLIMPINTLAATTPFKIKVVSVTETNIKINWTQVKGAEYYYVYYKADGDSKFYPLMKNGIKSKVKWYSNYSVSFNTLLPNTNVQFKIASVSKGKETTQIYILKTRTKDIPITLPSGIDLFLVSNDNNNKYLGKLSSNKYDQESIFNKYGKYGSEYSSESVWNNYGTYGSKYSNYSAFNPYTNKPPLIVDIDGNVYGYLTVNKYISGAVDPNYLAYILIKLKL